MVNITGVVFSLISFNESVEILWVQQGQGNQGKPYRGPGLKYICGLRFLHNDPCGVEPMLTGIFM